MWLSAFEGSNPSSRIKAKNLDTMRISKTKISQRAKRKTNTILVETIELAKKKDLMDLAKKLSTSTRRQAKINLEQLNKIKEAKIIIPGKVLGSGNIQHKITVIALAYSKSAENKLKKAGCETKIILHELQKSDLKGVKII